MSGFLKQNDLFEIQKKYYDQFVSIGNIAADLSGWEYSPDALTPQITTSTPTDTQLSRYYADTARKISDFKEPLRKLVAAWEMKDVPYDEFSLLPSTTIAMSLVIATLEEYGVKRVVFETPCYFAALENTKSRGWDIEFVQPIDVTKGRLDVSEILRTLESDNTCLWLHQPRYSVGNDLASDDFAAIAPAIYGNRFLVVDEANDDSFPSKISQALSVIPKQKLFRIKSLVKALGLNGINLSLILHDETHREALIDNMWRLGGTLDYFSQIGRASCRERV